MLLMNIRSVDIDLPNYVCLPEVGSDLCSKHILTFAILHIAFSLGHFFLFFVAHGKLGASLLKLSLSYAMNCIMC